MNVLHKFNNLGRIHNYQKLLRHTVLINQTRTLWNFRSTYEHNPVTDPKKLRFDTSHISHPILLQKLFEPRTKAFLYTILGLSIVGSLLLLTDAIMDDDSKETLEQEKKFQQELESAPERVKKYFHAKAESVEVSGNAIEHKVDASASNNDESTEVKKKHRVGFRDSRVIAYEDRIRAYSTPDKIFRYFGTIQDTNNEIYMTPKDFVCSITPGVKQPDGLGLDSFKKVDIRRDKIKNDVEKDSVFYMFGENALLNFSDYVFLLSVLSTPPRQFEIAFRMFDLNGDGELDINEFEVVRSIIHNGTPIGKRHRDNTVTGNTLNNNVNSSLSKFFFGADGNKKLTIDEFLKFQTDLQHEIMRLEFNRYDPVDGKIDEVDFADALLAYAGFSDNKKKKFLKRVKQKFDNDENSQGITFESYVDFSKLLQCIPDVDTALTFYHLAGASIDPQMLKHVSKAVADVDLDDHLIDIVFILFDENNDYHLSNKEFISVMKQRLLRGLDKPMDTGFIRMLTALTKCGKRMVFDQ